MEISRPFIDTLQDALIFCRLTKIKEILYNEYGAEISSSNIIDTWNEIVNICLDMKIDVNVPKSDYSALLHFVVKHLDRETFRFVLARSASFDINASNNVCRFKQIRKPLLHLVIEEGKYNLIQDLLEFGADINVRDPCQRTTLFYAVKSVEYELVEMFIKAGCDVNAKNKNGYMAMNYIFNKRKWQSDTSKKKRPYIEIINLLCSHGNNLDFNNKGGAYMLYGACALGLFKEVQFLLKFGANMFFVFSNGDTMLHAAAQSRNLKLVEFLMNNGLNIHAKNNDNETLVSKLISNYGGYKDSSSEGIRRDVDIIEFLADNGADVDVDPTNLMAPLEETISFNIPEIMECLLELKANIDVIESFIDIEHEHLFCEKSPSEVGKIQIDELFIAFLSTKIDISYYADKTFEEDFKWMMSMYEKCKLEINRMKTREICNNSNVSYLDFLLRDLIKLAKFCRNENITRALETEFYKNEFPLYKFFIEKRFRRAQLLKHYMEVTMQFLNEFSNNNLTTVVADIIFSFLKVGDIRNFGRALYA